jgi:hypothetical protein
MDMTRRGTHAYSWPDCTSKAVRPRTEIAAAGSLENSKQLFTFYFSPHDSFIHCTTPALPTTPSVFAIQVHFANAKVNECAYHRKWE